MILIQYNNYNYRSIDGGSIDGSKDRSINGSNVGIDGLLVLGGAIADFLFFISESGASIYRSMDGSIDRWVDQCIDGLIDRWVECWD